MGQLTNTTAEVQSAVDISFNGVIAEATGWDDIQGNVSTGKSQTAPIATTHTFGIAGGIAFNVERWAEGDYKDFIIQTPHAMKLNTVMENHFHYVTTDSGVGNIRFTLDVIAAGVNGTFTVPTGSPFTADTEITEDLTGIHSLFEVATIPASNPTVSSLYIMRLTRATDAPATKYSGDVIVLFADGHIEIDQARGSLSEYDKLNN